MKVLVLAAAVAMTTSSIATGETVPAEAEAAATSGVNNCADRIRQVRAERGLPPLSEDGGNVSTGTLFDRKPAMPDEGLLVSAVDHRVDRCGVLMVHDNPGDIRPVPQPQVRGIMFKP
jgi:hypothetical protein